MLHFSRCYRIIATLRPYPLVRPRVNPHYPPITPRWPYNRSAGPFALSPCAAMTYAACAIVNLRVTPTLLDCSIGGLGRSSGNTPST